MERENGKVIHDSKKMITKGMQAQFAKAYPIYIYNNL